MAHKRGKRKLQMPPVMNPKAEEPVILSKDFELQGLFRNGIEELQKAAHAKFRRGFLQLNEAEQVAMLQPLSDAADQVKSEKQTGIPAEVLWFQAIKNLTADGYYTSHVGLIQELGYDGNTAVSTFPQFVISEH